MSDKELAFHLLEEVPPYKLGYVIAYLQGLNADEAADDEFCSSLFETYLSRTDQKEFIPFDEAVKLCGVNSRAIYDQPFSKE